jgi:hypothetical protein
MAAIEDGSLLKLGDVLHPTILFYNRYMLITALSIYKYKMTQDAQICCNVS